MRDGNTGVMLVVCLARTLPRGWCQPLSAQHLSQLPRTSPPSPRSRSRQRLTPNPVAEKDAQDPDSLEGEEMFNTCGCVYTGHVQSSQQTHWCHQLNVPAARRENCHRPKAKSAAMGAEWRPSSGHWAKMFSVLSHLFAELV